MLGNMLPCIGYRAPYHTWQDLLGYILQNFNKYKGEMRQIQIQTQLRQIQIQMRHSWYKYEYIYKWEKIQMQMQIQMRNETNTNIYEKWDKYKYICMRNETNTNKNTNMLLFIGYCAPYYRGLTLCSDASARLTGIRYIWNTFEWRKGEGLIDTTLWWQ